MTSLRLTNGNGVPSIFDTFFDEIFNVPSFRVSPDRNTTPQVRVDVNDNAYDVSIATPRLAEGCCGCYYKRKHTHSHTRKQQRNRQ